MKFDDRLPFATIAIPAYNHERFVTECLNSAASQTYTNLDLVIVDDGSTDATFRHIEEFVAGHRTRFRNCQAITLAHRGVAATFNELFARSCTDWVLVIASDDVMYRDRVEVQMEAIRAWAEPDLAVVYGAVDWIGPDGKPIEPFVREHFDTGIRRDLYVEFLVANPPHGGCPAYHRAAVLAVGGFDESLPVEDFYISLELSLRFPVGFVNKKIAAYRRHGGNLSLQHKSSRLVWGILQATANFMEGHQDMVPEEVRRTVYRKNLLRAFRAARRGRLSAVPRLGWELATFNFSTKAPRDLYRYAELIGDSA